MKKIIIKKESIDEYVERETLKKMKISSIVFFIFFLFLFAFTYSYGVHNFIMPMFCFFILIILISIYFSSMSQIKNLINLTYFTISEDSVSKSIDKEKLNLMNKVGVSRNEFKYGMKYNETIKFTEIQSTSITKNEIKIYSIHYDFFTSEGQILLPKEVENYESIKSEIIKNSEIYKLE